MPYGPILLYDGVCGLCNRLVQFVLQRDRSEVFRFASLQSPFAARILARHNASPADLDTVYVVTNHDPAKEDQPEESVLLRSDAVLFIFKRLGGIWGPTASILRAVPGPVRDWAYQVVARNRYRIFGRYETCPLPDARHRHLFLDL